MASAKSSRSRAAHAGASVKGNVKDGGVKFEEHLRVFKSDNFDADGFVQSKCHSLSEKVCEDLLLLFCLFVAVDLFGNDHCLMIKEGISYLSVFCYCLL